MNAATLFVWFQNTVAPWLVDRASRIRIKDCLWYSEIAGVVVKIKAEHLLIDTHTLTHQTLTQSSTQQQQQGYEQQAVTQMSASLTSSSKNVPT